MSIPPSPGSEVESIIPQSPVISKIKKGKQIDEGLPFAGEDEPSHETKLGRASIVDVQLESLSSLSGTVTGKRKREESSIAAERDDPSRPPPNAQPNYPYVDASSSPPLWQSPSLSAVAKDNQIESGPSVHTLQPAQFPILQTDNSVTANLSDPNSSLNLVLEVDSAVSPPIVSPSVQVHTCSQDVPQDETDSNAADDDDDRGSIADSAIDGMGGSHVSRFLSYSRD